ncbi:uncharacterized protein K444DRAFT_645699 [Hyaloscypha bicolor E]|uniref:Integrase catalytic domain-containing protein n=1 Tax=Hyaloscypha bicolor E TaxID=1095630 RepID=A0A2J6SXK7_9HELO|nr:uncharacterized protein K444DRAFT_645699 [Hyaloscypha bicolor E]PMD55505.1 hypothetical protein K444DRAFT_645699 [Hyaloscypha bicolor E]
MDRLGLLGKAPGGFKFTLNDDHEFNYYIIVDVMYIDNKPVYHVVDKATAFQAARFLQDISAKTTWETLRICWIDNFALGEFKQYALSLDIDTKEVPVEAHKSVGKVERYHGPLCRVYEILTTELLATNKDVILQMAVNAINDSAGPDGIILVHPRSLIRAIS